MDDFVAVKGSGAPLFVLANVVDDIDMAITHVIRGEDLLPTTPRGILMWNAFAGIGWTTDGTVGPAGEPTPPLPVFAHLPMLVNEARKKLSKRKDPVAVESYRDQGYLADAFVNYLGLLGWSPPNDEAEVFTRDQMVSWFALADVNHSPAFFDVAKLTHMNGEYIRAMAPEAFIEACRPWLEGDGVPWPAASFDDAAFRAMAPVVQERVAVLGEVPGMVDFLFLDAPVIDPDSWQKALAGDEVAPAILAAATAAYEALRADWTAGALHAATLGVAESVGRKLGKAQAPIRVAVTGRRVGPPLFEALEVLGPDRTLGRLANAAALLAAGGPAPVVSARPGRTRPGPLIPVDAGIPLLAIRMLRLLFRLVKYLLIAVLVYLGVTAWQVWRTGQQYAPQAAGAIVVMGAAQYDGVPSPDLRARLEQAALLWHQHYSSTIMVTGSKEPGDAYTEARGRRPVPPVGGGAGSRHPPGRGPELVAEPGRMPPSCSSPVVTPTC